MRTRWRTASSTYDPEGRLYQNVANAVTTRFLYDGVNLIGEYNSSGQLQRRYVHGVGADEPLVWYDSAGNRKWLFADHQGSIVAVLNASSGATSINSYDEHGLPPPANTPNAGLFQYTGRVWLQDARLYYYKARMYSPGLGRFLQADLAGYSAGLNPYSYVRDDAVNLTDPTGLFAQCPTCVDEVVVTGKKEKIKTAEAVGRRGGYRHGNSRSDLA